MLSFIYIMLGGTVASIVVQCNLHSYQEHDSTHESFLLVRRIYLNDKK